MEAFPLMVPVVPPHMWEGFVDVALRVQFQLRVCAPYGAAASSSSASAALISPTGAVLHHIVDGVDGDVRVCELVRSHATSVQRMWRAAFAGTVAPVEAHGVRNAAAARADAIEQRIASFCADLVDLLEKLVSAAPRDGGGQFATLPSPAFYERILAEIEAVGWNRVTALDEAMTTLTLALRFAFHAISL